MSRDAWLTIHTAALRHNVQVVRERVATAQLYAMVKANGYGHGLDTVVRTLSPYVDGFGVAHLDEALQVVAETPSKPVLLLEGVFDPQEQKTAFEQGFHCVLHARWQLDLLRAHGASREAADVSLPVWLKLETGMHRLGLPEDAVPHCVSDLQLMPSVQLAGLMSHMACADQRVDPLSGMQLQRLKGMADELGLPFSASNSAALLRYPHSHGAMVRPGIMLYGSSPLEEACAHELGLRATQTLTAKIIAINTVPAGEAVGYGATWVAPQQTRVGVVAIGYGDGYPRHAPSGTPVFVCGRHAATVGRVSMDMTLIDLTEIPDAQVGSVVELWGEHVPVDDIARRCGTISYELFCQVTPRVARRIE